MSLWRRGPLFKRMPSAVANGPHTHERFVRSGPSYTCKVCEASTSTCSNEAIVTC